ncbi:MAG: clostripain-related cysteine peptidase [Candidatus Babeliales bacterium]
MQKRSLARRRILLLSFTLLGCLSVIYPHIRVPAKWTIVAYVQADNDLSPFAVYNINNMQLAPLGEGINMLVQWDQPDNNKTWRYRIVKGGRIEDASLSAEMGINPVNELVDMMRWAKAKYDAEKFAVILWNHGSGVIDPRYKKIDRFYAIGMSQLPFKRMVPWLEIPGLEIQSPRGILFDYSQNTYATNQDLTKAFSRIRTEVLGKNVAIVGMDACLMAMIEVGLQISNYADILVGSQETEPGQGWAYSGFLNALCANPKATSAQLASFIVSAYGAFYQKNRTPDFTQSAIDLHKLEPLKKNIISLIASIAACKKADAKNTKSMIVAARKSSLSFEVSDYIDLYTFYAGLSRQAKALRTSQAKLSRPNTLYIKALDRFIKVVDSGAVLILDAVVANIAGPSKSKAKGISIYYPLGAVHRSYPLTLFAKSTSWVAFIKEYR